MTDWWTGLRSAHIAAGVLAFVVAPVALATRKGSDAHRRWGRVYVAAMSFATLSAVALAAATGNTFFTFVGLFSFYLGFTGYRAVALRRLATGGRAGGVDWVASGGAAVACLAMLGYGSDGLARAGLFFLPLVVFGALGLWLAARDLRRYARRPAGPHDWLYAHMIGMVSSATAAVAAFSVVNFRFLPPPVRILWPAAVSLPLLYLWVRGYRRRLAARPLAEVVVLRG